MVPLVVLLALVPLAACGGDMQQMMQMMQQMQQMQNMGQMQQGWGWNNNGGMQQGGGQQQGGGMQQGGNQQGNWWGMQSQEDYEAYLKWCEEKQAAQAEQEQQMELMKMWEQRETERKAKMEKERMAHEAAERHEMMMSQWKSWQSKMEETAEFETLEYALMEMKHKYSYALTCEFLKFCQCSDFTEDLEKFFIHDGVSMSTSQEWNLDDLEGIDGNDAVAVAQALANRPAVDQVKAFFGGLAGSMCEGAKAYVMQLEQWEKEYKFMDRLL